MFGTQEGKSFRECEKPMKIGKGSVEISNSLKSNWSRRMNFCGPRCEGSGKIKVLSRLGPRNEASKLGNSHFGSRRVGGSKSDTLNLLISKQTLEHP
ncbi:hypothetical protein AVEN_273064-1 [Araneus ventricosus]|uniref:Uncharacterized protein n=1 Tax=Araneus ventricosus TaxID=182803 RepID=A0A4Y2PJY4_ARAVE|nr:hypothetical protein AVEN_273064-1 [Araneus ventricosus]